MFNRFLLALLVMVVTTDWVSAEENIPEFGTYEPSPAYPYGRRNPNAPAELAQFEFMLGANKCMDEMLQPDGSKQSFPARWNARYFMNGYGIQDHYWTPTEFTTSNLRIFDANTNTWKVTFFSMPGYGSGVWEGKKEGDDLVMRQITTSDEGKQRESRLTFYQITDQGFEWKAETWLDGELVSTGWTSSCKKVIP